MLAYKLLYFELWSEIFIIFIIYFIYLIIDFVSYIVEYYKGKNIFNECYSNSILLNFINCYNI